VEQIPFTLFLHVSNMQQCNAMIVTDDHFSHPGRANRDLGLGIIVLAVKK